VLRCCPAFFPHTGPPSKDARSGRTAKPITFLAPFRLSFPFGQMLLLRFAVRALVKLVFCRASIIINNHHHHHHHHHVLSVIVALP